MEPGDHRAAPSGEQHEIGYGRQRAVVTEVGATLRSYVVDDRPVLEGFEAGQMCTGARGQVLAPWPNRLGDGRYSFDDRSAQAPLDEPDRRNAIHGLVRWLPWHVVSRAQNVVTLSCLLHPQPGYPWSLELSVRYRLGREGLEVVVEASSPGGSAAPFGIGFHPYFSVGGAMVDRARLKVPAQRRLVTDDRGLPTSEAPVAGTELDFTAIRPIGATVLDTSFTGLVRDAGGRAVVEIDLPEARQRSALWVDESFHYLMLYTADTLESREQRRRSLAIEPMTCPPDALRTGVDLVRLEPGKMWRGGWGITPH